MRSLDTSSMQLMVRNIVIANIYEALVKMFCFTSASNRFPVTVCIVAAESQDTPSSGGVTIIPSALHTSRAVTGLMRAHILAKENPHNNHSVWARVAAIIQKI